MEYRKIKNTLVNPSILGFGCMRLPINSDESINEVEAEKMIDHAIKGGVTYIDTAFPYHQGNSEPFVGKVLKKYPRKDFLLATKLPIWDVKSEEDVRNIIDLQLSRLQVEYFDFYLLHALDSDRWETVKKFNIIPICMEYKKLGKIKNLGFSFHDEFPVFETIIHAHPWDFCQIQFNYLDAEIQAGIKGYALAESLDIPVIVMEPVKGGTLAVLPIEIEQLFTQFNPYKSVASWALRWVAQFPNVKVILSGMSTMEQVNDNLDTFNHYQALNEKEASIIHEVAHTIKAKMKNGCTNCEYCMPCPNGVDIPRNFRIWNDYAMYNNVEASKRRYFKHLDVAARADACIACGACEPLCPQNIHIIEDLLRVDQDMRKL